MTKEAWVHWSDVPADRQQRVIDVLQRTADFHRRWAKKLTIPTLQKEQEEQAEAYDTVIKHLRETA